MQLPFTPTLPDQAMPCNHNRPIKLCPLQEQGKEQGKAASGNAASGKGAKEVVMHPAQPVPVRLESESLDSGKGASKGKQEGTKGSQGSTKEGAASAEASLFGHPGCLVCSGELQQRGEGGGPGRGGGEGVVARETDWCMVDHPVAQPSLAEAAFEQCLLKQQAFR